MGLPRSTTKEFIAKARKVHGDYYDYSKVEYVNAKARVTIICPVHGEFQQIPNNHLNGKICKKCSKTRVNGRRRLTRLEFIERAVAVHGNFYLYDKTDYKIMSDMVKITCPNCGDFEQKASTHIQGSGCPKCSNGRSGYVNNVEKFIKEANFRHLGKYTYEKVTEVPRSTVKVIVTCPEHGDFTIRAFDHLNGSRCPFCTKKSNKRLTGLTLEEYAFRGIIHRKRGDI